MGEIVNGKRLGAIFGVEPRTISNWRKEGLPVHEDQGRGKDTLYDTAVTHQWLLARDGAAGTRDPGTVAARRRLLEIEAERRAIHLAREQGEVVLADDAEKLWSAQVTACRSRLLAIPTKATPRVVGLENHAEVNDVLQTLIYEALDELAGGNLDVEEVQP
ncbi:MAG: terminase small subunit [Thermodesulfobacteriota bacterium]